MCTGLVADTLQVLDEPLSAARVGITAIHETMHKCAIGYAVFLGDLHQFEQVIK